jgi:hypothetical protein
MTTATAFGSLWLSRHPGTSSMGELMALALLCTMMAAVLFQPALMGPPREVARDEPMPAPAEPEPMPAAAWAVQRIGTRLQHRPERATRTGSRQEQPETQDAPHEAEP